MSWTAPYTRRQSWSPTPVIQALVVSLAFHAALFSTLELSKRYQWFERNPLMRWLQAALLKPVQQVTPKHAALPPPEIPFMFVDVDPAQAVPEPPPEAKYYSIANTKAANPDPIIESNTPRIEGNQTKIVKTFDTLRPQPTPPQPQPQPKPPERKPETEAAENQPRPKVGPQPGEMIMAKAQPKPGPENNTPKNNAEQAQEKKLPRPRTVAEAKIQKGILVSPKMKQDGGVKKSGAVALDVKGTKFGAYDAAIVAAVQRRWYDLLDEQKYARNDMGKVVLEFRLNYDGRITAMTTTLTEVNELLAIFCQRAVLDPNPYAPWPSDMRREVGANYREVRFTFYYE